MPNPATIMSTNTCEVMPHHVDARPAKPTVIDALRQFLPDFLATRPPLSKPQWRAINAIENCRTEAMGGDIHACPDCSQLRFSWYSCNHKACPQCGRADTKIWVSRQLDKLTGAPYFMVTFTLPEELRYIFFGDLAKDAFNAFFKAVSRSLSKKLARKKWLGASVSGFTLVLHTWNQKLLFHPHIHAIVPGAGLRADGSLCTVKNADYLLKIDILQAAFRQAFRQELNRLEWTVDPVVWKKKWGINIQACGSGEPAIKYLGAYVARTAIADSRLIAVDDKSVTFRYKDRDRGIELPETIDGVEFVRRYIRHVLPPKMHSVRHYGFLHPAAKKKRERVQFFTGITLVIDSSQPEDPAPEKSAWPCPCCGKPMRLIGKHPRTFIQRHQTRPPPQCS